MKKLYCFDFDGTITTKDTMFLFLKYCQPKRYNWLMLKHLPHFILLKLKFADAEKVKTLLISDFLKGKSKDYLEKKAVAFYEKYHQQILRPNAIDYINKIDKTQNLVLLVTASLDVWVKPFANSLQIKLIATKIQYDNGVFYGKLSGKNCNNEEKVKRIHQYIQQEKFDSIYAFGDTSGDTAMLNWAKKSFFRFFH